jgi:thiamine kinase-like enzyme
LLPSGQLALADFEECGLGDPMFDVANWLAHLRWSSHFGRSRAASAYGKRLRAAALERFGWSERDLLVREAYAILLLCTNPVRSLRPDWAEMTEAGLRLARACLASLPRRRAA